MLKSIKVLTYMLVNNLTMLGLGSSVAKTTNSVYFYDGILLFEFNISSAHTTRPH